MDSQDKQAQNMPNSSTLQQLSQDFDQSNNKQPSIQSKQNIDKEKEEEDGKQNNQEIQAKNGSSTKNLTEHKLSIVSLQEIQLEDRFFNITEIYNVAMSPTSISIAFDSYLKQNVILKKIFKEKTNKLQQNQAVLECQLTCQFEHFNIVKGYDHYENDKEYILIMELINDADYFQEKVENVNTIYFKRYSYDRNKQYQGKQINIKKICFQINNQCHTPIKNELKLKSYITDILNGLLYIHDQENKNLSQQIQNLLKLGFIHCDLKLANIFCQKHDGDEEDEDFQIRRVKIGDLGLIQKVDRETNTAFIEEICGTFGFKAPEVKKGAHITQKIYQIAFFKQSDIWSLGIILYFMTVAYMPHHMKGYKYGQGPVPFREFDWKKRSPELLDFVQKMVSLDPNARPSARELLSHPFLSVCSIYQNYFV